MEQMAWCGPLSCFMIFACHPSSLLPPQTQAIWFTEQAGSEGSVFGNIDAWKGVGVILDSFDNDGLVRRCSEPGLDMANSAYVRMFQLESHYELLSRQSKHCLLTLWSTNLSAIAILSWYLDS